MKIQLVVSSLRFGGAERVAASLANAWARRGHEVTLTLFDSPHADAVYATDPGVRRISLGLYRPSRGILHAIAANMKRVLALRRTIRKTEPDVVVSFMVESNVLTILAGLALNTMVVVSEHTDPLKHDPGRAWAVLRRHTYGWAAAVVVLTAAAEAFFKDQSRANIRVIPNPVVVDDRASTADEEVWAGHPVILAMGRLCPEKNFEVLIRAFAAVTKRCPQWRLVILGDGPSRGDLEDLVESLGVATCVSLPGAVANPYPYLHRADLFVSSSLLEGFPMAICEAMACGRAVIAVEYGAGVHEIITSGVNGVVVREGGVNQLAEVMMYWMDKPEQRQRLSAAAAAITERYGLSAVLDRWDALFSELLPASSKRGMRNNARIV